MVEYRAGQSKSHDNQKRSELTVMNTQNENGLEQTNGHSGQMGRMRGTLGEHEASVDQEASKGSLDATGLDTNTLTIDQQDFDEFAPLKPNVSALNTKYTHLKNEAERKECMYPCCLGPSEGRESS